MSDVARNVLSIDFETGKFNYRVVGLAVREGHVLVCRDEDDDYVMLPGGRAELGEPSTVALAREIEEELQCPAEIGRLLFTAESFYHAGGETHHEIGFYYALTLPEDFPFTTQGVCLETVETDEGKRLRFYWVKAEPEALRHMVLYPEWIHNHLVPLPEMPRHIIADER